MADIIYNNVRQKALTGAINFSTDTMKMVLLNNSYIPALAHATMGDITAYEISGTGYSGGGLTISGLAVTETNGVAKWTFTSPN
jgi:hypothetical protein